MKLQCLGSSSKGNCYLFQSSNEILIWECGISIKDVKIALDFDLSKVVGAIVSHSHSDHFGKVKEYINAGIDIYAGKDTIGDISNHKIHEIHDMVSFSIGEFKIKPFFVVHDVPCFAFLIKHSESGMMLCFTDTHYIPYKFSGLNNILGEINYDINIANENIAMGASQSVRDRVLYTHMELSTFKEFLLANDMKAVNNVVLLHLSDSNSNAKEFKKTVEKALPGKTVWVAENNMTIELNKTPF